MKLGTTNEQSRQDWVKTTLSKLPAGARILDAGAGECQYKIYCKHLNYVSQDFSKYDGQGDKHGLQAGQWSVEEIDIVSDISSIPQPTGSFDVVLCTEVLEHLPDPLLALKEFQRLLRQGGQLILTAPFASLTHFAPFHYSSGFNRYFYQHHLPELGFEVVSIEVNGNFFSVLAQEIRRIPQVLQNHGKGKLYRLELYALRFFLRVLEKISHRSQGSEELLCFGYHVVAQKV